MGGKGGGWGEGEASLLHQGIEQAVRCSPPHLLSCLLMKRKEATQKSPML